MSNGIQASIDALVKLKREFAAAHKKFPNLYYAKITGDIVRNGGAAFPQVDDSFMTIEALLQDHIADGMDHNECVGWKHPRYFFLGKNLSRALKRFRALTEPLHKIIRDGLNAVQQEAGAKDLSGGLLPEHGHLLGTKSL
jgi:hypothetical protein